MLKKILKFISSFSDITIQSNSGNVAGGRIIIDGKVVQNLDTNCSYEIIIEGNVKSLNTQGSVRARDVKGKIDTMGSVHINK